MRLNTTTKNNLLAAVLAIANAVVLLTICYLVDNWGYSTFAGLSVGQRIEQARELLGVAEDRFPEEYVFINTAYDRKLVEVDDEYGLPEGVIDITDRGKIADFLSRLNDQHRYVMIDVLFSDRFRSEEDSLLTAAILNTDKVGIARSSTTALIDSVLLPKAGYTDYSADIYESNFVKYEFSRNGEPTLPYKLYLTECPANEARKIGPFYFRNGQLAWNSLILRFPIKLRDEAFAEDGEGREEKRIYNLGADILDMGMDIPELVRDKIVVIGDFREDDFHDTYLGKIAGAVINVNAYEALRHHELEIPWWLILTLLTVYAVITFIIFLPKRFYRWRLRWINKIREKSKFIGYLFSFIGFSFVLLLLASIIYLVSGYDINIFIPSLWFTALLGIKNYLRYAKK